VDATHTAGRVAGATAADNAVAHNIDNQSYQLCIETERIYYTGEGFDATPPAFPANQVRPGLISYDGGTRWTSVSIPVSGGFDISRAINRGATIHLAVGSGRAPVVEADTNKPTATIWIFPAIAERPKAERVKLDFFKLLDPATNGGNTTDRWTIEGMSDENIGTLQIALSDGRDPAGSGWGTIRTGDHAAGAGITVQTQADARGRIAPTQYLVRVAPVATPLTPGSSPARVRAAGASKAPSLRVDFRNESIRGRAGTIWQTNANAANTAVETWRLGTAITRENAREAGMIKILYGASYAFRTAPTADRPGRPASLWQRINVPAQDTLTVAAIMGGALKNTNNRLVLERGTNIFDGTRERWGGAPRAPAAAGDSIVRVRQAATMKHNPRHAGTDKEFEGKTATNEVSVTLTYGNIATGANAEARPRIALTGFSVPVDALTKLQPNEILFSTPTTPAITMDSLNVNTIPASTPIATFRVYFGKDPSVASELIDPESYVLSGLPAPFATTGTSNVGMAFDGASVTKHNDNNWSALATISTSAAVEITANVTVGARVAIATSGTPAAPVIPNAAFWSATASRVLNFVSATVGTVDVIGTANAAITTPRDVVITLSNATFEEIAANEPVGSWFTNMPTGMTAVTKSAVVAGATSITITIAGSPNAALSAAMAITIPAVRLATPANGAITVTANPNAKWTIAAS
jgi:hypothetical protein